MHHGDHPLHPKALSPQLSTGSPDEGTEPSSSPGIALSLTKEYTLLRGSPIQTLVSLIQFQPPRRTISAPEMAMGLGRPSSPLQGNSFPSLPRPALLTPSEDSQPRSSGVSPKTHWCFERLGKVVTTAILKQMTVARHQTMISESYRPLIRAGKQDVARILETLVRNLLNREWERNCMKIWGPAT